MKLIITTMIAILLAAIAAVGYWYYTHYTFSHTPPDFAGEYRCKGFDPYLNKAYSGLLNVIPQDTVYRISMAYDTGEKYKGTAGLFDRDTLAVVFQDLSDPNRVGLERYSYSKDRKRIQGYWVYLGESKLGKEVCEKMDQVNP